jgi:carbon starvation protein CstA
VDFIVLPSWKIFMIQFLNIAGTGPIFGAIMGAKFGPAAYLWIVLGCIFAGATHDYLSGMLSIRNGGANLPDIIGKYLGNVTKQVMLVFSVFLLIMVGAVFVFSPAKILGDMWEPAYFTETFGPYIFWIAIVFIYYLIATMMPIDKIIGRIYPLFAFSLLFMAGALMVMLFVKHPDIPELWEGVSGDLLTTQNIFPCLFITIACGAISGFHATQTPLMARCVKHEKMGRPMFYGAMITEGIVALIWATVAMYFFYDEPQPGYQLMGLGSDATKDAPTIVNLICNDWLGVAGGILALLGAPVPAQLASMVIVSVVCFIVCMIWIKPKLDERHRMNAEHTNADRVLGKEGIVIKTIDPLAGVGQVKVIGQVWSAKADTVIDEGTLVTVRSMEGVKLIVEKADKG